MLSKVMTFFVNLMQKKELGDFPNPLNGETLLQPEFILTFAILWIMQNLNNIFYSPGTK